LRIFSLRDPREAGEAYPCAAESPRPFWADGLELSRGWFAENLGRNVEGFHVEEGGRVIGHIYWAPSERALVPYRTEPGVAWIYCEWIQQPYQGKSYMRALFSAFVEHLRKEGYKGILVGATDYESYMHYSHFAKRGFNVIREGEGGKLMYLPLGQESVEVEPLTPRIPVGGKDPVEILIVGSRFCPVGAATVLYLREAAAEFGDRVSIVEVPAGPEALARYGVADGIYLNGNPIFFGPVTKDQVRATIHRALLESDRGP